MTIGRRNWSGATRVVVYCLVVLFLGTYILSTLPIAQMQSGKGDAKAETTSQTKESPPNNPDVSMIELSPHQIDHTSSGGAAPSAPTTSFSNPAAIACADRTSNNAGTNPGLPPGAVYPSTINVSGLSGVVTKVTVTFAITSTFPDDFDILLVGPTGAQSLIMSDAGGSGDHTNVTFTFDQSAAAPLPDNPTAVNAAGTYQPSNYLGLATPEPGGQDNFPAPGGGLASYPTTLNVFNGTAPNGAWRLFVVDDQVIDSNSLPSGWSIDITTTGAGVGQEKEPNDTSATANPITGSEAKIRGSVIPATDVDFYSFPAVTGDKIYAAVQTAWSPGSVNSVLELRDTNGTTVLETDLDDGSFGATSSSIAGFTITAPGTYFLQVRENAAAGTIRPYDLYFTRRTGAPTAETEPNNTTGTATPLAASRWMSGSVNPAADVDFFSVALNAGDSVYLSLDIDPERDNVQWNGRLGLGLFGTGSTQILVVNDASTGSVANPLSEAFFFTVKNAGTYFVYVDEPAAGGGATFTYNLSVNVLPAPTAANCTTYASTNVPVAIGAGAPPITVTSTITVPGNPIIGLMTVGVELNHTFMQDLDVELRGPAATDANTVGLFNDIGAATVGGPQTGMNLILDDRAGIPPSFALSESMIHQPENSYRLDWFRGQPGGGTWTLTIRDDATGDGGTLTNWNITICTESVVPLANTVFSTNFEAGDAGFTHSGTADEWERGTPATVATSGSPPIAGFTSCNSGVNCWKTDLDNTYELSSSQDLLSPSINLAGATAARLDWAQRFQMESATFDHYFVSVYEVGNQAATERRMYEFDGATMTLGVGAGPLVNVPEAAGWGTYHANLNEFLNKIIQVRFHVDSDTSVNLAGVAIDDVAVLARLSPTASVGMISGRIADPAGAPVGGTVVHLGGTFTRTTVTDSSGNYHFDDLETGNFYTVTPSLANYSFSPAGRSFALNGNMTDAGFTASPDPSQSANAIDTTEYFVRQQYLDFLGREPDQGGLEYWSSQFDVCNGDATCIRNKRIDVSAAFFASLEFQQTGSYIYGLYAGTLGRTPGYGEFMPDRAQVVGGSGLEPAKAAFAQNFVQRAEFTNRYPQSMSREQFVDAVIQTMQVRSGMFMTSYRDRFLNDYDTGGRALVVRHAAEAGDFVAAEYNRAFVLMEYFGYLRRDIDPGGYAFWLDVLNRGAGSRGMVCSFLTSTEYQHRFSTIITHSNAECGQ
jgi:subtilisin-like proprotein convertase family protein